MRTTDEPDTSTPRGRIFEAVAIAVLTALGTKLVEVLDEHLKRRRRRKRAKPKQPP